ncbi:restriction endonuclease subunit S [Crenothrix polyspora]|uniref:Putative Restriction modification system DNA specificity domain n=1 Tax=Crenothrix polyspora TaxID=360316 RepID=A0A1R4H888_9GAMM|nr:restriction endonuclease subunit S [Crenothrix polyspora]SJM92475.1 putative Restriction modification system DNA specificity domain [Crenothrix polyspora]
MITPLIPLKDIVTFKGGGTPSKKNPEFWDGNIPWASVKDFKNQKLSKTQDHISLLGLNNSSSNLIAKGHVIIPTRMALGKAAINTIDLAINQDLRALIPKIEIHTEYLLYAVLSLANEIEKLGSGATVKGITQENLYNLNIRLHNFDDQIRIATLLSRVEALIATRKDNLRLLDEFLKSTFLEMFGDPVRNEKGWVISDFSALFSTPPRIGTIEPVSSDGNIPVVRVGELGSKEVNFCQCRYVSLTPNEIEKYKLIPGDILLARAIGSQSHLGKASLFTSYTSEIVFDSHVMRIRFHRNLVDPIFLYNWLKSDGGRRCFLNASGRTSVQFNINSKQISTIVIPLPPIELQNQFAAIVEKTESLKNYYQQNLTELENLYGALSQKAFKGELDLSHIPLNQALSGSSE